jgi:glycosyltransferase involved in cell wall biosynthesis
MVGPAVVIPNWNGRHWLPGCLASLAAQQLPPAEVIVVDNGSADGSLEYLAAEHPSVRVLALAHTTGFAHAANRGIEAAATEAVALINTDIELDPDWLARMTAALDAHPASAGMACKMVALADPAEIYDAGDILRRDGACEQRGRFMRDAGSYDTPGEVFGACAGAALFRREAVLSVGGFDERFFAYLEDIDLALVQRNTLVLVARAFPLRWLPQVAYRQLGWAWHALRDGVLGDHLRGTLAALPMLPAALRERRALRAGALVPIEQVVGRRPIRGPRAGGWAASRGLR